MPCHAATHEIENGVDDFSNIHAARTTTWFGWRNQVFEQLPLLIAQISTIG
jgi:hypothetical protein